MYSLNILYKISVVNLSCPQNATLRFNQHFTVNAEYARHENAANTEYGNSKLYKHAKMYVI